MNEPLPLDKHLPENLRIPPNSLEAEQAILGGLLLNNSAWDDVAERVGARDFYRKAHRQIFEVIAQLVEEENPCDLVTVSQALTQLGQLEGIGGMTYLSELARNTPSAANITAYAEIVRERSILRHPGDGTLVLVELINAIHGFLEDRFDVLGARAFLLLLGNLENGGFRLVENFQGFAPFRLERKPWIALMSSTRTRVPSPG